MNVVISFSFDAHVRQTSKFWPSAGRNLRLNFDYIYASYTLKSFRILMRRKYTLLIISNKILLVRI